MKLMVCVLVSGLALVASGSLARATPEDYCEAYAVDFANRVSRDDAAWAIRHDNSLRDCLAQYQQSKIDVKKPEIAKKTKRVVPASKPEQVASKPAAVKLPEEAIVEPDPVDVPPEPAVIVAPDIEPPAKPARNQAGTIEPKKAKTLFAKLFTRNDQPSVAGESVPVDRGKLQPGSAAWLDYCDSKYASFNRETGTYVSYKGVARRCLVTN